MNMIDDQALPLVTCLLRN